MRHIRKFSRILIFGLGGCLAVFTGIKDAISIYDARDWIKTTALVDSVYVQESNKRTGKDYFPIIKYHYRINEKVFHNDRLTLDRKVVYDNEFKAIKSIDTLIFDTTELKVNIFYDPEDHSNSTILRPSVGMSYYLIAIGIFLLVIGYYLVITGRYKYNE